MEMKKEQLLFVIKICTLFFATAILGSYLFYKMNGIAEMPLILVEQWLVLDAFLFVGLLLGSTDVVIKTKSTVARSIIVSIILYVAGMVILSNLKWNPFENSVKFWGTTFLFVCISFVVSSIYVMWQKAQSDKYKNLLEEFKVASTND